MTLSTHVIKNNNFLLTPNTFKEAMDYADLISKSSFCPDSMRGKSGDILVAMQMGAEVGLSPMQAIQNIAVIKGRPCLWGDAALALVLSHSQYESHREWTDGSLKEGNLTAFCAITRKGSEEYIKSFSLEDAKKAGLWGKAGPWTQYPQRMLQMRARGFAIRDKFADALKGINIAEEVSDYDVSPKKKGNVVNLKPTVIDAEVVNDISEDIEIKFTEWLADIGTSETMEKLQEVFNSFKRKDFGGRQDLFKKLIDAKDKKKNELIAKSATQEWLQDYDQTTEVNNNEHISGE